MQCPDTGRSQRRVGRLPLGPKKLKNVRLKRPEKMKKDPPPHFCRIYGPEICTLITLRCRASWKPGIFERCER